MNEVKHYTIVTTRGLEKIQAKYQASQTVNLTHMGFGGANEYIAPNAAATVVPNQWAKVPLERHPDTGFIGGGATVSNKEEYKGHWLGSVGIYDEDGELILIAATPLVEISLDESVVASYPIDIYTVLDNASSVVVVTDTSTTYPTHDELNTAIEAVKAEIPVAASAEEVTEGVSDKVWVSPKTLLSQLSNIRNSIKELYKTVESKLNKSVFDDFIEGYNEFKKNVQDNLTSMSKTSDYRADITADFLVGGSITAYKKNGVVTIEFNLLVKNNIIITSGLVRGAIPDGYRPVTTFNVTTKARVTKPNDYTLHSDAWLVVDGSGDIRLYPQDLADSTYGTSVRLSLTYLAQE
jgi:hypothetical protein